MLLSAISIVISLVALGIAATTLWLTHFQRGELLLSQPTIFFFGWDIGDRTVAKITFRSVLFCTSERGLVLENLYLRVVNQSGSFVFSFWGYDDGKGMVRGSGVYVGETGIAAYHHFTPGVDDNDFEFVVGEYSVEVWAKIFNSKDAVLLGSYSFEVEDDKQIAEALSHSQRGVIWDWMPDNRRYVAVPNSGKRSARTLNRVTEWS